MKVCRIQTVAACVAALAVLSCGKEQPSTGAAGKPAVQAAQKVVEEKVPPYSYPPPVKGHVKEINIGSFDLVDGVAYPSMGGSGTVVHVVSRPIASPMLADSACPLTQARALSILRNASFAEVTLDAAGRSKYFAAGTALGGSLTDQTRGAWSGHLKLDGGHAAGAVAHRQYGKFEFDLPLSSPKVDEISNGDSDLKRKLPASTPKPTERAVAAAYIAVRDAALKKDFKDMLRALGFDAKQNAAIRGLDGIDADFAVFTDRFLTPGAPSDPWGKPGSGQVRAEGVKANGKKFTNDYYFDVCGDRLVLTYIVEQSSK
jgi:hypothetical protein